MNPAAGSAPTSGLARDRARSAWLKTLHQWHWISAAVSLLGMLLFAATGLTLNHADSIEAKPVVVDRSATLPAALRPAIAGDARKGPLAPEVAAWVAQALRVQVAGIEADWAPDEVAVALPRPGGDAEVRIDRTSGEAQYEDTDRGWIAYLNDLHKGRHTGAAWRLFIDAFAVACLVFTVTGLCILQLHAGRRPTTWPLVGLGVLLPVVLMLLFIH